MPKTILTHTLFKKDHTLLTGFGLDKLVKAFTWFSRDAYDIHICTLKFMNISQILDYIFFGVNTGL